MSTYFADWDKYGVQTMPFEQQKDFFEIQIF